MLYQCLILPQSAPHYIMWQTYWQLARFHNRSPNTWLVLAYLPSPKRNQTAPDIRPIAVGEVLRRLVGKCLCLLSRQKAANFFQPFQNGVACPGGAEKIIHKVRQCVDNHWSDGNFALLKVDMTNAFNLVSRQTFLEECSKHFPKLLPWSSWCYGRHPSLWHLMGILSSEVGVQQGDPLGPLLFSVALQKLISFIHNALICG